MFLKHIDLTTALRPSYLPDEVLHFVQDNVGLYEGELHCPREPALKMAAYLDSTGNTRSRTIRMGMCI